MTTSLSMAATQPPVFGDDKKIRKSSSSYALSKIASTVRHLLLIVLALFDNNFY
jgi:hypothetical protein